MKIISFYLLFWVLGVVLAFFIFRGLLFLFYLPTQEILDEFNNNQYMTNLRRAGILLTWCQIALILSVVSQILFVLIRAKFKYAGLVITLLIASLSSVYFAYGTTFEGNNYQYSFIAMTVFGGVSLVLPSSIVGYMRNQKHSKMIKKTFD
ncbi:MAG: hypothetical protein L3J05_03750 [Robiginitomaculum sp.]|nr:hypothetical protein [Robiginitomaculum sp.]